MANKYYNRNNKSNEYYYIYIIHYLRELFTRILIYS